MKIKLKHSLTNNLLSWGNALKIKSRYYYVGIAAMNIIKISKNWSKILLWHISNNGKSILVKLRNKLLVFFIILDLISL